MGIPVRLIAVATLALASPSVYASSPVHRALAPGSVFRDCRDCPEMVVIPSGRFSMGTPVGEKGTLSLEQPVHSVTIRSFAAGRFDVTRDQYATFVSATHRRTIPGCEFTGRPGPVVDSKGSWSSLGFRQTGRHPVVCVNWEDAADYAAWLSRKTGKRYRLLSEAEWEYAARAGTQTPFYWGMRADHDRLNYGRQKGYGTGVSKGRDRWIYTSPVGAFPPNPFGLYDMSGNVLQFVQDCLGAYDRTPKDGSAYSRDEPLTLTGDLAELNGTTSCTYRVARGGDWGDPPEAVRSAARNFAPPPGGPLKEYRSGGVGFRVARDLWR